MTSMTGTLHEDVCTFMIIRCWILLRMRNISEKFVEKIKINMLYSITFLENSSVYVIMWKMWYIETGHRWQYTRPHALWMLDNQGYGHTLRICYAYCFPRQQWLREYASTLRYTWALLLLLDIKPAGTKRILCFKRLKVNFMPRSSFNFGKY
jgi:hypothetical protein